MTGRTDMAAECHENLKNCGDSLSGIKNETFEKDGMGISRIKVSSQQGADAIGKPMGTYITLSAKNDWNGDSGEIEIASQLISRLLKPLLPENGTVMIVGLGNTYITPDSLGPLTVDKVMVTRHLINQLPLSFKGLRPVCAVKAGVLGCTGVETAEMVKGICGMVNPSAVIAIDALASLSVKRLCRSFQISDTGIVPGAGVCNARKALNKNTLGIPVIAMGVPTVVDAKTLEGIPSDNNQKSDLDDMLVIPRDIDALIEKSAKVLGYGINMALHGEMTVADIEQFLC